MNEDHIRNVVEAALLAAGRPLGLAELAQLFDEEARPAPAALREALGRIGDDHASRALELREVASGWRLQVRAEFAPEVSRLWPERPQRYSRALLETLALIAYRQPITRAEIEAVRGVAVNPNIVKTLMERNWVRVVGHRDVPGHPELLGTTKDFLDHFGLADLDELPPLAELKALADLNPQLALPVGGDDEEPVLVPDTAPTVGEPPAGDATLVVWIWLGEPSGASARQGEVCRGLTATPLVARQDAAHEVGFTFADPPPASGLRADHWHQVAIVRRGDDATVHVDGAATPHVRAAAGREAIVIGAGLQGKLDEVALFDRPLSVEEIAALWSAGSGGR